MLRSLTLPVPYRSLSRTHLQSIIGFGISAILTKLVDKYIHQLLDTTVNTILIVLLTKFFDFLLPSKNSVPQYRLQPAWLGPKILIGSPTLPAEAGTAERCLVSVCD